MTETNQEADEPVEIAAMQTGIYGLDTVLGGGLARGAIYLVMGRPGTGKTTLGNQLCFTHVAGGGRAVYLTLLAESHASMLKNLRSMRFFDISAINQSLIYVGAYKALRDNKLAGLLDIVRRIIGDERATLLVIDGISPVRSFADSDVALKEFVVELQMLSVMTGCTTVLLANMTAEDANGPEHTMVDGLIELAFTRSRLTTKRTLEVIKLRGARHLLGLHELAITDDGIKVFPRIEEVLDGEEHTPAPPERRLSSGVAQLDEMLDGGLRAGTTSVILGFTGSGKTTLSLQFLSAGVERNEMSLYFGFYEPPARILDAAAQIGLPLAEATKRGAFSQLWQPPYAYGLDALAYRLLDDVKKRGVRRLVIDGLDGFRQAAVNPERTIRYLTALSNELRALDVTTLITEETVQMNGPEIGMRVEGTSALTDNLFMLEYLTVGTGLRRLLSIIKQRGSVHSSHVREFHLTSRGIVTEPDSRSAEAILSSVDVLGSRRSRQPHPSSTG